MAESNETTPPSFEMVADAVRILNDAFQYLHPDHFSDETPTGQRNFEVWFSQTAVDSDFIGRETANVIHDAIDTINHALATFPWLHVERETSNAFALSIKFEMAG